MHGKKFHFSTPFVTKLIELTEGKISSDLFENLLLRLEQSASVYFFDLPAEANLLRIFSSIYDTAFFFGEMIRYPHHAEILASISANSNYLTDIVVRNPEYLYQVFDQDYLTGGTLYNDLAREIEGAEKFKSFGAKVNYLRQQKRRNILRIGLGDIVGLNDLATVTGQLSALAKYIIAKLFDLCYREVLLKNKVSGPQKSYCLCSLGKLGGDELNYSSDVDLILFYENDNFNYPAKKNYQEILSEAALLFIKTSTEITDHGYIYRIDFRLRPDGKSSPLCNSIGSYMKYYETRGEDWERQMLIKLNFVCGDENLYARFHDFIEPFIYPSTFSESIKDKVRDMKRNIERQNSQIENVKTFQGGIRDIEFAVQTLQMLNGGRNILLRSSNTLKSVMLLTDHNLLKKSESRVFTEAYIFYRQIEHFLQLMNDRQTHTIPSDKENHKKIARRLNLNSAEEFKKILKTFRHDVRSIYDEILSTGDNLPANHFDKIHFANSARSVRNIAFLRSGRGIINRKEFDTRTIELFGAIEPAIIHYLKECPDPDKVLDNFVKVLRGVKFPSVWFSEFSNAKSLRNFLNICLYSQRAIDIISTGKQFEDLFLSHQVYIKKLENLTESPMSEIILSVSVQFALRLINAERASAILSSVIKQKIESLSADLNSEYNYFIGGLGSFGSVSMSFSSDVDLIIVADNVDSNPAIQKDFQNFIIKINEAIKPFTVDFKLRPEGNKSPLVWDIKNYSGYLQKRARVWEFQSLSKLIFVCGDRNLFNVFRNVLLKRFGELEPGSVHSKIVDMYLDIQKQNIRGSGFNIKKERGGLLTIDFILRLLLLPDLKKCFGRTNSGLFSLLKKIIPADDLMALKNNYLLLSTTALAVQNITGANSTIMPWSPEVKTALINFLKVKDADEFDNKINEAIKSNNLLFEKYASQH